MSEIISPMLRLFQEGAKSYQPEGDGFAPETGDPQVSLENLRRIMAVGRTIQQILAKPNGVLVLFDGDQQFYAPGLRASTDGPATAALARIAAEAGFGPYDELFTFYRDLAADWDGPLPDMKWETLPPSIRARLGISSDGTRKEPKATSPR
jgi:hypothetical protein